MQRTMTACSDISMHYLMLCTMSDNLKEALVSMRNSETDLLGVLQRVSLFRVLNVV